MYKLNDILLSVYGIIPGKMKGEGIAVKGNFDLPKRIGVTKKDWGDEDSVEPYVDADEIFLGGRTIFFAGVILGNNEIVEANLMSLRTAINSYLTVVPFETPYGTYCVYIKKITPKFYRDGATIIIEFREPVLGASCGVGEIEEIIYYSVEAYLDADKNDCDTGEYGDTVRLYASDSQEFPFESNLSQDAADFAAATWLRNNAQAYANQTGNCNPNPTIYKNVEKTGSLQKDDCGGGFTGSNVIYTVAPGKYSSIVSQAEADGFAQDEVDDELTQAYANENGTCLEDDKSEMFIAGNTHTGPGGTRTQTFLIGAVVIVGAIYKLTVYSHTASYTAIGGDSPVDVVNGLISAINGTTEGQWNDHNSAPNSGTPGFKPVASVGNGPGTAIKIILNYQNQFSAWVTNP